MRTKRPIGPGFAAKKAGSKVHKSRPRILLAERTNQGYGRLLKTIRKAILPFFLTPGTPLALYKSDLIVPNRLGLG